MKVVMKFGGSLLASEGGIPRVSKLLSKASKRMKVVVVISAFGDVTDLLLQAAMNAKTWDSTQVIHFVDRIRGIHTRPLAEIGLRPAAYNESIDQVEELLEDLKLTLSGVSILRELTSRSKDLILSFGERLSIVVVSAELRQAGIAIELLTGGAAGIVTDESFGEARPDVARTRKEVMETLLPLFRKGVVPVVAGCIARSATGEITTLGRGGSDYTATLLADAISADEVWIWTDVDGILTADPRIVKNARVIEELSYAEAEEMSFFGAKNMHPLSLVPARKAGIPVRIKNGFKPDRFGTLINPKVKMSSAIAKSVALISDVGIVTVSGETLVGRPGTAAKIFELLGDAGVNVLMISQSVSESNISAVVRKGALERAASSLADGLSRVGISATVKVEPEVSVLAVVGAGMKGTPGMAAKVFSAVASAGVNVIMIAQGSSELNISFVVASKDSEKAVIALHESVVLEK